MKKLFKHLLVISFLLMTFISIAVPINTYAVNQTNANTTKDDAGNGGSLTTTGQSTTSSSDDYSDCRTFLGMPSWDCHLPKDWSGDNLKKNVWIIAGNIADAIVKIATYIAVGFVIYGGYLYIFSSGDPAKASSGKKTLSRALIGLAIVGLANIIVGSAGIAILGSNGTFNNLDCTIENASCPTPERLVNNMLNWIIGIAGVIAAIYVVIGGIGYITSAGDPNKLQKSKTTIVYSLIGLAIVGLSLIITNNGVNIILAANHGEDIRTPIISLLNSVIGFLGVVAVIFVVKGGFTYMTSNGDPGKLKSAKDTILYACIGLIVCALSFAIVNWAINAINSGPSNSETEESYYPTKKISTHPNTLF